MGRVAGRCGAFLISFLYVVSFPKVDISFVSTMCREFCSNVAIYFKEPYTFVCGYGIAVCVEQNYIVCIMGNINYVLTEILYWTSLKQRHFYRTF